MKNILLLCLFFSTVFGLDNSSLNEKKLLKHQKTYGVVFIVPQKALEEVNTRIKGVLTETLIQNNLIKEAVTYNIPHITVLHIHNPDTNTPYKLLQNLPKPPKPFDLNLAHYSFIKASPNSNFPWWFDIGVEKTDGYETIMQYNFIATKALTPLRATPVPRATGFIYQDLPASAKSQIKELGSNGLNRIKNNQEEKQHRPHMTLVYSTTPLTKNILEAMQTFQKDMNQTMTTPIKVHFDNISIVELGFSGNVLREIYRISLEDGKIYDVEKGEFIQAPKAINID